MDRRRAAGLLLALAACFATATAAPTASNHTALDLYDGAPDGCYYNFQHYGEGDRIMTNEPCLNCTCHNRMLMCYLRVCPFTKPIGQDCTIEKRADQCCPIVTCPDVPVDLLTSTTTSPAEYGPTGVGKLDKFGCSINGKYFSEGSKVPPTPNKPCEHCYCIRNMTTCVMQECTLHVDGCTPIYHKDVCCPVRYSCDHPEDEMPLLDDLSTTVRPTQGFLLSTTTISPVTQITQDCLYDNRIFSDGALIKTEKACDHCYCMKGDIVCVVQECGTPMENEGKNCTAIAPREGVCCPDTYICEGDESSTETYETDEFTTHTGQEKLTTLSPPRRTSSEGSGYRNEPDEGPYTESSVLEPEIEGSGEDEEHKQTEEITTDKTKLESTDDILESTEETHEFIPLTTTKPKEEEKTEAEVIKEDEGLIISGDIEKTTESQQRLPSTTGFYSTTDFEELITDKTGDIGSGELPEDFKPHEENSVSPFTQENMATTEIYEQNIITTRFTEDTEHSRTSEPQKPITSAPLLKEEMTDKPSEQDAVINEIGDSTTSISTIEHDSTTAIIPSVQESPKSPDSTVSSIVSEETDTKDLEPANLTTLRTPIIEEEVKETTKSTEEKVVTGLPDNYVKEDNLETHRYPSSTSTPSLDDEFVTTEAQDIPTDRIKETEFSEAQQVTANTPMLEEIEKDTTEYTEPEQVIPSDATQDDKLSIFSTTITNIPVKENDKDVTESTIFVEHIPEEYLPGTTNIPVFDQQEQTTAVHENIPEAPIDTSIKESSKPEEPSPSTTTSSLIDNERKTTLDLGIEGSEYDNEQQEFGLSSTVSALETKETTTEPDKGQNTIPSEGIEEAIPVSPVQEPTATEEKVTTEADLAMRFTTESEYIISSTISDTSVSREEQSTSTTESAFRKEDYSPTEAQISPKLTTVAPGVPEEVMSTTVQDYIKSTESSLDLEHETHTTLVPKYTDSMEETKLDKEISNVPNYESSTFEASVVSEISSEKTTMSTPLHEKEMTTANQDDNEIFNEPRIPGEGDCLLNGVTYTNASAVPSTNKCQSGCKCFSSIIKCDPIICSPPPEYMDNCETMYDTPDACCPTYICDHKTETIPPQSHSQMSGTEAPVMPVHCHGDECEISKDQKHHDEPSDACKSGSCAGPSDEPKETAGYPHSEHIPEKPTKVLSEECVGDDCKQVLCTNENGCQATPVQPCEGEKCETSPEVILPPETQQCAHGEDCAVSNIPVKECLGDNCDTSGPQLEGTQPTEICTGKEGCRNVLQLPEEECKEDHCRRKDSSPLDQNISEPCTAPDCKPTQTDTQTSTVPALAQTSQVTDEDNKKDIPDATEKFEAFTESTEPHSVDISELPEAHEMVTKHQEITGEESLTTVFDINKLVTKPEPEITTKATEYTDNQEVTSGDFVTDSDKPLFTESPEYQSSVSLETTKKDSDIDISLSSGDAEVEMTDKSITQKDIIDTDRPQELTTEKLTSVKLSDGTESTKAYTPETQMTTEPADKPKSETETPVFSEGSSTEPSIPFTMESHEMSTPSIEIKDEISTHIAIDSSTELTKSQDDMKKPDILEHADTTITLIQESSTEPSRTFAPDLESITGASQETEPTKSTGSISINDYEEGVSQRATEPTTIGANEQVGDTDQISTVSEPSKYDTTTVSAITDDFQKITESKSPDAIHLTEGTEHKETSSEITEETTTELSKSSIAESSEITKSSESFDQEVTTPKFLDRTSTASTSYYIEEQHEITASQETEKITTEVYESITLPPKTQTETQSDIKSPEDIERDVITTTGTETTESYSTEPKIPENIYHEDTTLKISEESSSKIYDTEDQPITQSNEINEVSSETPVTNLQMVPEEIDRKETSSETPDKSVTETINEYPIEQQEDNKSPIEIDQETTTDNDLDVSGTEPPKSFDTKPHISILPDEDTTSMISQATEPPLSYTTVSQDTLITSEESFATTIKAISESASESSKSEEEVKHELETLTGKPFVESEILETITTSQELSTSKTDELTTPSSIFDTKIATTPEQEVLIETTEAPTSDLESKPPQTEGSAETESLVKEHVSTTSVPIDHDFAISVTPLASDSDKTIYAENTPKSTELEKPTTSSSTSALEEVSQPDLEATKHPETAAATEKTVSQETDTEIKVPAFIPIETDELRTTSSEIYDLTTPRSTESSKPHDTEVAYTPQQEQNTENISIVSQEASDEVIGTETEKTVILEIISTDKPETTAYPDFTSEIESGTGLSQLSSESTPAVQESYTEESSTKYSSPEPSAGYDSTKAYPDKPTVDPVYSKVPQKQEDVLIQSLVTEQYETDTKPSGFEKDSQAPTPTQISSLTPEEDIKQTPESSDNVKDELSTPSSISAETTLKEFDDKTVISTDYENPAEDIRTESPSYVDKIESETTTQKKPLPETGAVTQEPSAPELNEVITSSITEHKPTTDHADTIAIDIATEAMTPDTSFTDKQELASSEKTSVDFNKTPTESSYTTEISEKHTESTLETTKVSDVKIQAETSETVTSELPETPSGMEILTPKPIHEEHDSTVEDQQFTDTFEPGKKQSELTTVEPSTENEVSSQFELTTAPRQEYPEATSSRPSEEVENTDKIEEESTKTSVAGELTTESTSSERYTEKQPETLQTIAPEKATPVEEYVTTRKQLESEVYQTTTPAVEVIGEMFTHPSVSLEERLTTLDYDIEQKPPTKEQSIPVVISETEKIFTSEEPIAVQTERVIPSPEKPILETTTPEEEFIIATSKVTTAKIEEEISTLSPFVDRTAKPIDLPDESYSTAVPDAYITVASEGPISIVPEEHVTMVPDIGVDVSTPGVPVTKTPEVSVTTESETLVTKTPDAPVTTEPDVTATKASEAPITIAPEATITNAPEATEMPEALITNAPDAPITNAPEAPITDVSGAPKEPITNPPKTSITSAPEMPEASIANVPEAPITNAPEAPITSAPETHLTNASEAPTSSGPVAPITNAPELPVTAVPELPKPVSTEAQPTDEVLTTDEEGSFPPSGGTSGYGQEPDYVEEDQTFGPGTCRYGGKVYVSAQQIPRDDPCDFCFCFRSDIICLQQSCPPPIHGCHEEPIQGFCCPRYECPVSMATSVNVTTTTTTTTTTLPPHFPTHSYKGSVQKRGCQVKGQTYKVGEVVRASSGPCLHCTCGGDGQMKCDPKVCTPEPMLRQMIAAAVSAKRRR